MSIFSDRDCGAMDDFEFRNACAQMNNAEAYYVDRCSRCGWEIDYHGAVDIDGEHLCWLCFKKDDLKDQRDFWDEEDTMYEEEDDEK